MSTKVEQTLHVANSIYYANEVINKLNEQGWRCVQVAQNGGIIMLFERPVDNSAI